MKKISETNKDVKKVRNIFEYSSIFGRIKDRIFLNFKYHKWWNFGVSVEKTGLVSESGPFQWQFGDHFGVGIISGAVHHSIHATCPRRATRKVHGGVTRKFTYVIDRPLRCYCVERSKSVRSFS